MHSVSLTVAKTCNVQHTHATYYMLEGHQPQLTKEESGQKTSSSIHDSFSPHSHKQKMKSTPKTWPPFKSSKKEENFAEKTWSKPQRVHKKYMQKHKLNLKNPSRYIQELKKLKQNFLKLKTLLWNVDT